MSRQLEITLDARGERLDRALASAYPDLSRSQWQQHIANGLVTIAGRPVRASMRLEGGELVHASLPDALSSAPQGQEIPLDIIYEDGDLLALNKTAGMVVHPAPGHSEGTLVNALLGYSPDLEQIGGELRAGIVHRLDRDTSGLILVAKNERALRHLQRQFKARKVIKRYLALVEGHVQPPQALIDAPIGRDPRHRQRMVVVPPGSSVRSRPAQTEYHLRQFYGPYSLLDCYPRTGRTHQIRVHLAFAGYPIVGDAVYGRRKQRLPLPRHFLHAHTLTFRRPADDTEMTLEAPLPQELAALLQSLHTA